MAVVIAIVGDSSCLADVNAKVADGMLTMGVDWQMFIAKVADGMATGSMF